MKRLSSHYQDSIPLTPTRFKPRILPAQHQLHNEAGMTIALPIPNIDAAPVALSALLRENLFGTPDELSRAIGTHYLYAVLRQVHKVVLSVEMLDTPMASIRALGTGVKDLFYLPAQVRALKLAAYKPHSASFPAFIFWEACRT